MKSTLSKFGRHAVNLVLIGLIAILYFSTVHPMTHLPVGKMVFSPIYRGNARGKIALQIAVDWDAASLVPIMDILQERGTHVTFAVSGGWAKSNPDLLQRIVQDGHEVATMGNDTHRDGNLEWIQNDILMSVEAIYSVCGIRPMLYYPGNRDLARSTRAAYGLGVTPVACTADLLSGRGNSLDIFDRALDNRFDGSIMLLQPTNMALTALPSILEMLSSEGFTVSTVSDVLSNNKTG